MKTLFALALVAGLSSCASSRMLVRPDTPPATDHAWLSGRLSVTGLETERWGDPLESPLVGSFLLAAFTDARGTVLMSPAKADGTFLCSMPSGSYQLTHLLVATRTGDLLTARVEPPLALTLTSGGWDAGGLRWEPKGTARMRWQQALQNDLHAARRLTLAGRLEPVADVRPAHLLAARLGASAVRETDVARRGRLYGRLAELARRLGI